jgi:DeoR family transcriptional regulator, aga operon transcriptional repressor
MLALIQERQFVRVAELGAEFGISDVTVRNDLDVLVSRGHVHRFRGGATPRAAAGLERAYEETQSSFAAEKLAIGEAAAGLVHDGEAVILDVGTTSVAVAHALVARTELHDVVVFTNGLKTALELEPAIERLQIVVLGGTLRRLQHSLVDPLAGEILSQITVGTVFLGCSGVDPIGGITNVNLPEAQVKKRMLAVARRRIVLADGSKIGRVELAQLCPISEVDLVITGVSADPDAVQALRDAGCDVVIAT